MSLVLLSVSVQQEYSSFSSPKITLSIDCCDQNNCLNWIQLQIKSSVIKYFTCFQGRLGYIYCLCHYVDQLKFTNFSLPRLGSVIPSRRQHDCIWNGIYSYCLEITEAFWHILIFDFCENQTSKSKSRRIRTKRKGNGEHLAKWSLAQALHPTDTSNLFTGTVLMSKNKDLRTQIMWPP